jgi:hypothetical protein
VDVETFYTTVSSISFTLLGLWWVVVQGRETWRMNPARRRMAYVVSLHFVLPGIMSILALVGPDLSVLWRVTFVVAGLLGLIGAGYVATTLTDEHDCPRLVRVIEWIAAPIYVLIAIVAIVPEAIGSLGLPLTPLQVEGIILAILIFFGVQAAWILMVEPPREAAAEPRRPDAWVERS